MTVHLLAKLYYLLKRDNKLKISFFGNYSQYFSEFYEEYTNFKNIIIMFFTRNFREILIDIFHLCRKFFIFFF